MLCEINMKNRFTEIYKNKTWFKGSGSGSSSTNTILYRNFLQDYFTENRIKSVIDIGCGDWKFSKLINWNDIKYLGLDVVDSVISTNKEKYQTDTIKFKCVDMQNFAPPKANLVIIKDVLQHCPNKTIKTFLPKLAGFKHILITDTCDGENINQDILEGQMRPLVLDQKPFNFKVKKFFYYKSYRPIKKIYETKCISRLYF